MAFVASQTGKTFIVAGGPAIVNVAVPQMVDVSGNCPSNPLFSHYSVTAAGGTGGGINATVNIGTATVYAVPPGATTVPVSSVAASDVYVLFGQSL